MKIEGKLTLNMVDFWVWVNKVLEKKMEKDEIVRETIENGHVDSVNLENDELVLHRDYYEDIKIPGEHFWEWVNSKHKLPVSILFSKVEFLIGSGEIVLDFKSE